VYLFEKIISGGGEDLARFDRAACVSPKPDQF